MANFRRRSTGWLLLARVLTSLKPKFRNLVIRLLLLDACLAQPSTITNRFVRPSKPSTDVPFTEEPFTGHQSGAPLTACRRTAPGDPRHAPDPVFCPVVSTSWYPL